MHVYVANEVLPPSSNYLVGQDVDVVSDIYGLDLLSNTLLILVALQTLGVGFLHDIHLMHSGNEKLRPLP